MISVYRNPMGGEKDFVPLGTHQDQDGKIYELYAVGSSDIGTLSFGARYSDNPQDYLSGLATRDESGEWQFYGTLPVILAAARYFAALSEQLKNPFLASA